ncbi:acyltransferase [Microbacterium sp. A93]|uniref:acyltransferase n=1 Tax=Microbacterium sp. A93 TaxID=3450716 RepID=UPI003F41D44B
MTEAQRSVDVTVAAGADVSYQASIGAGSKIWHLAQVREQAVLGRNCIVGRGAYIGTGVTVGDNCKIQNHALVYEPAQLGDGVFIGPAVVLTNDTYPRAINADGTQKSASDWEAVGVVIERGASIGARAVCVAPLTIGAWALVAAGSVVTRDVPAHALMAGVPARRIGWVGTTARRLERHGEVLVCPDTGERYCEEGEALTRLGDDGTVAPHDNGEGSGH